MNRFALLSLYRSLARHKLYAVLNVGGLAVGIAVFLTLSLYVRFETGFEKWIAGHDKIYIVQDVWNVPGSFIGTSQDTMPGMFEYMESDFPDLLGTRIKTPSATVLRNGVGTDERLALVDPDFLRVFPLTVVSGDAAGALASPNNLILERAVAKKYFPEGAMGKTLSMTVAGRPGIYRVAAIVEDLPVQTHLTLGMLTRIVPPTDDPLWYHWGSESLKTYLRFDTPRQAAQFQSGLDEFIRRHAATAFGTAPLQSLRLSLLPLDNYHLLQRSTRITVTTLGLIGILTLVIAVVNYVNLAVARFGLRAREVAVRKVLGGTRSALVTQFLVEAVIIAALSALVGLIIAELGLPWVNAAGGTALSIPYALVLPGLVLLALVLGLVAGFYPALLLSRIPAAAVLASSRAPGGGRAGTRVREALVILQFGLATALIIGTLVLVSQTMHVRKASLGYDRTALVIVPSFKAPDLDESRHAALFAAFQRLPGVEAATYADAAPGDASTVNNNNIQLPGRSGGGPTLQSIATGPRFFQTLGAKLIAGRVFDEEHRDDDVKGRSWNDPHNIVITRLAASALGFSSPEQAVGKRVGQSAPRTIIGVVDDLRLYSPREPLRPTYFEYRSTYRAQASDPIVILRTQDADATLAGVRAAWLRLAPTVPFEARTASRNLAQFYEADDRITRLFSIGAVLAVLIGCVGLWGLASFNTQRRVKEIGIRKTLGASSSDIVTLLIGQFLRPVLIANVVAWPLAYLAMRTWLSGFDDRIALSPLYFLGASVLAVAIAVLTVLGQSLRASRAAPAWALRHE